MEQWEQLAQSVTQRNISVELFETAGSGRSWRFIGFVQHLRVRTEGIAVISCTNGTVMEVDVHQSPLTRTDQAYNFVHDAVAYTFCQTYGR